MFLRLQDFWLYSPEYIRDILDTNDIESEDIDEDYITVVNLWLDYLDYSDREIFLDPNFIDIYRSINPQIHGINRLRLTLAQYDPEEYPYDEYYDTEEKSLSDNLYLLNGKYYDRDELIDWLQNYPYDPETGEPVDLEILYDLGL